MDLYSAGHRRGVVCAPHFATVEAGREILAEGGNALEAMVAMAATIAAVYPHMNHLGGDGYWLIREPSGRGCAILAARGGGGPQRCFLPPHESPGRRWLLPHPRAVRAGVRHHGGRRCRRTRAARVLRR